MSPLHRSAHWILGAVLLPLACGSPRSFAYEPLSSASLRDHVELLAADDMRGREAGSREAIVAADYIASVFEAAGLEAFGEQGSWFQTLDFEGRKLTRPPSLVLRGAGSDPVFCQYGVDYYLMSGSRSVHDAPLVIVDQLDTLPERNPGESQAILLDLGDGRSNMRASRDHAQQLASVADLVLLAWSDGPGQPADPPMSVSSSAGSGATVLLRGELLGRVRAGDFDHVQLDLQGSDAVAAVNVIGMLRGVGTPARPELAQEIVVFTAHYDHIGTGQVSDDEPDADVIYNGANDDASGVAFVLELARALSEGERPARSALFMAVTAEEKGLLGSRYFVAHPTVPLEKVVCDLNIEMVGVPDGLAGGFGSLFVTGFDQSNLGTAWSAAGLAFVDDPYPSRQYYRRSDNASFVQHGIIGHSLSSGGEFEHYHKVGDEAAAMDYGHMEASLKAVLDASRQVLSGELDPTWAPDAEHGELP
jgi:hypothetical protein